MQLHGLKSTRKSILLKMWDKEESNLLFKTVPKKSSKYQEHQEMIATLESKMYPEAKEAIIEKWITYAKNRYIDEVMDWRLALLKMKPTKEECLLLKTRFCYLRLKMRF